MRRLAAVVVSCALVLGSEACDAKHPEEPRPTMTDNHRDFASFAAAFLHDFFAGAPTEATRAGDHEFDGAWPDPSVRGQADRRAFYDRTLRDLGALDKASLDAQARIDAAIVENTVTYLASELDDRAPWERDPMAYTTMLGDGLDPLVTRSFAPLEARATSLRARLAGIPAVVAVAKARLGAETPRVFTETAIQQNKGLVELCDGDVATTFAALPEAQKGPLLVAAKAAADALRDFAVFLEKDLLPRSRGDFRLGRAAFEKKLRFELDDDLDADAIARGARELLHATQIEMFETAKAAWPRVAPGEPMPPAGTDAEKRAFLKRALDATASHHSTNASIVGDAKGLLDKATRFVAEHALVTVPPEPCAVIEMPEYRRGFSVAYCDASGPLEAKQETFFAIAPTPKDWSAERAASFYREYNQSMLADLTVHEAMPGHFLQLMHNNRFPSKLRGVFQSGSFVEGWAVYAEWLMAKHGFGGPEVALMRQKMVLRLSANAILDHGIHAGGMDERAALDLMMNEAFQEEGEAVGKWRRARLSSAQLTTYYYGFTEMMKLRAAAEKRPGFVEQAWHDRLLSYGSPPFRHLRGLMADVK